MSSRKKWRFDCVLLPQRIKDGATKRREESRTEQPETTAVKRRKLAYGSSVSSETDESICDFGFCEKKKHHLSRITDAASDREAEKNAEHTSHKDYTISNQEREPDYFQASESSPLASTFVVAGKQTDPKFFSNSNGSVNPPQIAANEIRSIRLSTGDASEDDIDLVKTTEMSINCAPTIGRTRLARSTTLNQNHFSPSAIGSSNGDDENYDSPSAPSESEDGSEIDTVSNTCLPAISMPVRARYAPIAQYDPTPIPSLLRKPSSSSSTMETAVPRTQIYSASEGASASRRDPTHSAPTVLDVPTYTNAPIVSVWASPNTPKSVARQRKRTEQVYVYASDPSTPSSYSQTSVPEPISSSKPHMTNPGSPSQPAVISSSQAESARKTVSSTPHDNTSQHDRALRAILELPPAISFLSGESASATNATKTLKVVRYGDDKYGWANGMHICRHDLDHAVDPKSHINSSCAILSRFDGMFYSPILRAVICQQHCGAFSLEGVEQHLRNHHKSTRSDTGLPMDTIMAHITKMFRIFESFDSLLQYITTAKFEEKLSFLPKPVEVMPCHLCKGWYVTCYTFRQHLRGSSACLIELMTASPAQSTQDEVVYQASAEAEKRRAYGSRIFWGTGTNAKYYVIYEGTSFPTTTSSQSTRAMIDQADTLITTSPWPYWLGSAGLNWSGYLKRLLDSGSSWSTLRDLVSLPSKDNMLRWEHGSLGRRVEMGLMVLSPIPARYLSDANYLVIQGGPEISSWFYQLTSSKFRDIDEKTLCRYRYLILKMIVLVARFTVIRMTYDVHQLGDFSPMTSPNEVKIHFELFRELRRGDKADPDKLAVQMHYLLMEVFTRPVDTRAAVSSLLQQVMVLSSMILQVGYFQPANTITQQFAMGKRWAFSTFIHQAFLGESETTFTFIIREDKGAEHEDYDEDENISEPVGPRDSVIASRPDSGHSKSSNLDETNNTFERNEDRELEGFMAIHSGNGVEVNQIDSQCADQGAHLQGGRAGYGEDDDENTFELFSRLVPGTLSQDSMLEHLTNFRQYLTPVIGEAPTEMNRLYAQWSYLKTVADQEKGKAEIEWDDNNEYLTLSWCNIRDKIDIVGLRQAILREAASVEECFRKLTAGSTAENFYLDALEDDHRYISVFDNPTNKAVFDDFVASFKSQAIPHIYRQDGSIRAKSAKLRSEVTDFLHRWFTFLQNHMIPHLYHTCGIPPRAWQTAQLLYRTLSGNQRNLFMTNRGLVYIANLSAKQRDKTIYQAYFPLTPLLGRIIVFYLGVIRPIEMELRSAYSANNFVHEYHIFVCQDFRQKGLNYISEAQVNEGLKASQVLPYEARAQRRVFNAILNRFFPVLGLGNGSTPSPIIKQGQHTPNTKQTNYAITRLQKILGDDRSSQFSVGQTLQGWLELIPPEYEFNLFQIEHNFTVGEISKNSGHALLAAVIGVRTRYCLDQRLEETIEEGILRAMVDFDFLGYDSSTETNLFGTELLVNVTAAVVFGGSQPSPFSASVAGVDVEYVLEATFLILRALEAWRNDCAATPKAHDTVSVTIRGRYRQSLETIVEFVREYCSDAWQSFWKRVHASSSMD